MHGELQGIDFQFILKRNTDPLARTRHLIKKAYLLNAKTKQDLLQKLNNFVKKHNLHTIDWSSVSTTCARAESIIQLVYVLTLFEQLKHFQKYRLNFYKHAIIPKANVYTLVNTLLHTPGGIESYKNLPDYLECNKTRTKLYACTCNNYSKSYSIFKILLDSSVFYTHIVTKLVYNWQNIPLYWVEKPLCYLLFYRQLSTNLKLEPATKLKHITPHFYFKHVKRFYIKQTTVHKLSTFVNSKKRAKKYLRILAKRLKLYIKKKPKWLY